MNIIFFPFFIELLQIDRPYCSFAILNYNVSIFIEIAQHGGCVKLKKHLDFTFRLCTKIVFEWLPSLKVMNYVPLAASVLKCINVLNIDSNIRINQETNNYFIFLLQLLCIF